MREEGAAKEGLEEDANNCYNARLTTKHHNMVFITHVFCP